MKKLTNFEKLNESINENKGDLDVAEQTLKIKQYL